MVSTATPTPRQRDTATDTHLLAVTTQFSPPEGRDCIIHDLVESQAADELPLSSSDSTDITYIYSDPLDPRFAACQPSGWADRPASIQFSFSPAVCPKDWGWTTINLLNIGEDAEYTTAVCCAPDYEFDGIFDYTDKTFMGRCSRTFGGPYNSKESITATLSHGKGATTTLTSGTLIHEPWHIAWRSSDQEHLQVTPPALGGRTTGLLRWDGKATTVDPGDAMTSEPVPDGGSLGNGTSLIALYAVLPSVVFALIVGWIGYIVHSKHKARRQQAAQPSGSS